jgi:RimJ/RimL family protein N-acetyltransferase
MTVTFQEVADRDREALVDFMFAHAPIMMFPLTNLTRYGLGGDNARAISAWVAKDGDAITDVLTISREGMVFPCCPSGHWDAAAAVLAGRKIKGFIGDGPQVVALREALGVTAQAELDATEPAFLLTIANLKPPATAGFALKPLSAAPYDLMVQWRANYEVETLFVPEPAASARAEQQVRNFMATDSHRVLFKGDTPVGMTGFNATLPEIVQVGGIYTPPALRGHGYARKALALHLTEVAIDGVTEAVLSSANDAASRVYQSLGFERTGDFALVVYETSQVADV